MTLTVFDGIFLGVILAGVIWGSWKGLTWELATVASLVLGYLVAYPSAGKLAPSFPGNASVAWLLALAAAYVLVSGGSFGAAWMLRSTLRKYKFEAYDRHLGGIVGGIGGMALAIVGTVLTISVAPGTRQPILTSTSGKAISRVLETVHDALPDSVHKTMEPFWRAAHGEGLVAEHPDEATDDSTNAAETETPRVARRDANRDRDRDRDHDRDPQTDDREAESGSDSLLDDIIEQGGKRIGKAVSDAVESRAREAVSGSGRRPR